MSKASIPKHLLIMLVVTVALIAALFIFFRYIPTTARLFRCLT